jgi:hypothetical protein
LVQDVDLVLSEGYKKDVQPKIEIFRKEKHKELLCKREDNLVAIVSNQPFDVGVPCLGLEDMRGLADFIEARFLKTKKNGEVSLRVNGKPVPLTSFVSDFVRNTVRGMLSALKGCQDARRIEIHIEDENHP